MTNKKERLLLGLLATIQFSNIVDFMIMMPLGPQLMRIFSIDPHQFGLLVSSYTFMAAFSGFTAAFFIDRFDRKTCLLFFYLGFGLGTIACALAPNYHFLLAARAFTGLFGGVLGSLTQTIVGDAFPFEKRGSAMGILMASFSAASVLGVPFSLFLANRYFWHAPFMFLGVVSVFVWVLCFKLVPSMTTHLRSELSRETPSQLINGVIHNSNQMAALVFIFALVLGQFSMIPFLSPSLVANAGMGENQLPWIYLLGGGVTMFTGPMIGRAADKFGKKKIFTIFAALSTIPMFLLTHLGVTPLPLILCITVALFICMGGRMIPAMAIITATAPAATRGSFMSFVNCIQQLAAAFASYAAGLIIIRGDGGRLMHYDTVGFIAIGSTFLGLILIQRIKPMTSHERSLESQADTAI